MRGGTALRGRLQFWGVYDGALFTRARDFNLLLHEPFGGGFSPTAVLKLRRLARKVARGSVDRTAYSPKYSLSFMSHHAERISLSLSRSRGLEVGYPSAALGSEDWSVVRGVNRAIRSHLANPVCTSRARVNRAPGPK